MPLCERCGLEQQNHAARRLFFVVGLRDRETQEPLFMLRTPQGPYTLHVACLRELEQRGFILVYARVPSVGGA